MENQNNSLSRREFLQRLALGTAGAVFATLGGRQIWVSAVAPKDDPVDGSEEDPRSIDNLKELGSSAISKDTTTAALQLSDGTVVDEKLAPAWQEGAKIEIQETEEGQFLAWTMNTNPVWMWAGEEAEDLPHNDIRWSQPEIASYGDDQAAGILFERVAKTAGSLSLITTVEDIPYGLALPKTTLLDLNLQHLRGTLVSDNLLVNVEQPSQTELTVQEAQGNGFTIEMWIKAHGGAQVFMGDDYELQYDPEANGFLLKWGDILTASPPLEDTLADWHHVCIIVDYGPQTISWVMDGVLNRQFGWARFPTELHSPNGNHSLRLSPSESVELASLRIYGRALRTAETIISYQSYGQGMGIFDYI